MVEQVPAGRSPRALANEFDYSEQVIHKWPWQADIDEGRRDDGLSRDEREELRRLRREVRQLKEEREILKKGEEELRMVQ